MSHFRYQRLTYDKMLAMLPARPYTKALDVGCGLGGFTRLLAPCVCRAVGMELSGVAVAYAKALSVDFPTLSFEQAGVEDLATQGAGSVDLIILADVIYYLQPLSDATLTKLIATVEQCLKPDGILLLSNHFFFSLDIQSRQVRRIHDAFRSARSLHYLQEQQHPFFLATTFQKTV